MIPEIEIHREGRVVIDRITLTATGERFRAWRIDTQSVGLDRCRLDREGDDMFITLAAGLHTKYVASVDVDTVLRITNTKGWQSMFNRPDGQTVRIVIWKPDDLRVEYQREIPF